VHHEDELEEAQAEPLRALADHGPILAQAGRGPVSPSADRFDVVHYTEYDTRLAVYAVLVDDRDRILLTWFNGGQRGLQPGWSLPGGGVDFDEGLEAAVVREVHEETGYDVEVGRLIAEHHFTGRREGGRPFRAQRLLFAATIVGGRLGTVETDGTTDFARWVPRTDWPLSEHTAEIVQVGLDAWWGPQI
jgi:8-oxo-dGTP diphosphatase